MRITDERKGLALTKLCTSTIRAVAMGVIGVAFIQALLAGVIMSLAGIPAVGIFFVLALILGIAQVPVILVTGPAIAFMWMAGITAPCSTSSTQCCWSWPAWPTTCSSRCCWDVASMRPCR